MATPATRSFPLLRLRAALWPFRTHPFAEATLGGSPAGTLVRRRLFGRTVWLDVSRSSTHRLLYLTGERLVEERHLLRREIRPGMRVADVGANIGYYMLLMAQLVGPTGWVHCFEPDPDNLAELRRNRTANGLENVRVSAAAVGERDGITAFRPGLNGTVCAPGAAGLTVDVVRLDSAWEGALDFVKIDVEGYEGQVLQGALGLIERHRPTLFVEVHPWLLQAPFTPEAVLDLLRPYYGPPKAFARRPSARGRAGATDRARGPTCLREQVSGFRFQWGL